MSFGKLPTVDDAAKASEESVHAVKGHFSRKNGFISREEYPDYGTDLAVELISQQSSAAGKHFPIQIKSEEEGGLVSIDNIEYWAKSFKTSRLYYLCQQSPAYGLIILYNAEDHCCYYEFVEEVVNRINFEKGDQSWHRQDSVTIHIPKTNLLDKLAVGIIYQRLTNRFDAHELLISQYGNEFSIPSFSSSIKGKKEPAAIGSLKPAEILEQYGLSFLNTADINTLLEILGQIPFSQIVASKQLVFFSSVAYSETGRCIEAEMWLNKAFAVIDSYNLQERELLEWMRFKVDWLMGRSSQQEFFEKVNTLAESASDKFNAIQFKTNVFYYKVLEQIGNEIFDVSLEQQIISHFTYIEQLEAKDDMKHFLKVFQAENLHMFISSRMLKWVHQMRLREQSSNPIAKSIKIDMLLNTNKMIGFATKTFFEALQFAQKNSNKLLAAHALFALARTFLTREFDFMLLNFKQADQKNIESFKRSFQQACQAHDFFTEFDLLKEARLSLITAFDLHRLAVLHYQIDITSGLIDENQLVSRIKKYEQEMGLGKPYVSVVDAAFEKKRPETGEHSSASFENLTDRQIKEHATSYLNMQKLPVERLKNVIKEMESLRWFAKFGNNDEYIVYVNSTFGLLWETKFSTPTCYTLKARASGKESHPSEDLTTLAEEFGALKKG